MRDENPEGSQPSKHSLLPLSRSKASSHPIRLDPEPLTKLLREVEVNVCETCFVCTAKISVGGRVVVWCEGRWCWREGKMGPTAPILTRRFDWRLR